MVTQTAADLAHLNSDFSPLQDGYQFLNLSGHPPTNHDRSGLTTRPTMETIPAVAGSNESDPQMQLHDTGDGSSLINSSPKTAQDVRHSPSNMQVDEPALAETPGASNNPSVSTPTDERRPEPAAAQQSKEATQGPTTISPSEGLRIAALHALDPMLEQYARTSLGDYLLPKGPTDTSSAGASSPKRSFSFADSSPPRPVKKTRGAFSEQRRLEVRNVRHKGACMRCRMLKKSCGENDPCKECSKLENARLWKGQCTRTRLFDTLTVYHAGYFVVLRHFAEQRLRYSECREAALPGRLEFSHFPGSGVFLSSRCRRAPDKMVLAMVEQDNVDEKLKWYAHKILHQQLSSEDFSNSVLQISPFVRETLRVAVSLCEEKLVSGWYAACVKFPTNSSRTASYPTLSISGSAHTSSQPQKPQTAPCPSTPPNPPQPLPSSPTQISPHNYRSKSTKPHQSTSSPNNSTAPPNSAVKSSPSVSSPTSNKSSSTASNPPSSSSSSAPC
jgi:hypothetical protein